MWYRISGALILAAAVSAAVATVAVADIVDLSNGVRLPKKSAIKSPWGEFPKDSELRASGRGNLKLAYDAFEIDGKRGDAAQISAIYVTNAILENTAFAAGEQNGVRGYWVEAAEAFRTAAEELTGAAKQVALYKRMVAAANTGSAEATLQAAEELLASDAKTYYFGPAQETRARIFARAGSLPNALVALKKVMDAPGMNARDYFSAAYLREWLTKFIAADSPEEFKIAEQAFRDLLTEVERHPRRELAQVPKMKIMMSLAASVRSTGQSEAAKKIFGDILAATDDKTDKSVLAGVYYGLGDVAFEEAAALQAKVKADPSLKPQVKEALEASVLHYLRVILLYKDFAGQRELFGATRGAARTFARLFDVGGEKDCDLGRRAYDYYVQAVNMQPRGEARRLLVGEGKDLKIRIDEVCSEGEKEGEGEPGDEGG